MFKIMQRFSASIMVSGSYSELEQSMAHFKRLPHIPSERPSIIKQLVKRPLRELGFPG